MSCDREPERRRIAPSCASFSKRWSLGWANRTAAPGTALEVAVELAENIARNGPRAVRAAVRVIRDCANQTMREAIGSEIAAAVTLIASGECSHGISALMTKTKPTFPDPD